MQPGDRLGPYEIVAPLGAGGMGEVWRARDRRLERDVAVKIVRGAKADSADALARFEREARAVAALSHPNILAIHDVGNEGETLYAVMELLEGATLRDRIAQSEIGLPRALDWGLQIAQGLAAAHERGIVHRDLKPENIFVTRDGVVKILDFGLARIDRDVDGPGDSEQTVAMTTPGMILGTVAYVSPEQARGEVADARSDIFAFGAVFFEMLTRKPAFLRGSKSETIASVLRDEPKAIPDSGRLPAEVEEIISHCLEKNLDERFRSARDLAFALRLATRSTSSSGASMARSNASGSGESLRSTPRPAEFPARPAPPSIAVLPFRNLSPDSETEYFSDGMTEEVINSLSAVSSLRVASRTTSFAFKGKSDDIRRIGRELGVGMVLEGSVRQSGTRLRVTAQLVNVEDGYQLWSNRWDREIADVFAVQDEIAQAIASTLKLRVDDGRSGGPGSRTRVIEAYDHYLKGTFHWRQRRTVEAIEELDAAVVADPDFADAQTALANAWAVRGFYGGVPTWEAWARARAAIDEAERIAPDSAGVALSRGILEHYYGWNTARCQEFCRLATERDPKSGDAWGWLAINLASAGNRQEAIDAADHGIEVEPHDANIRTSKAWAWLYAGDFATGLEILQEAVRVDPTGYARWSLGSALRYVGRHRESVELLENLVEASGGRTSFYVAQLAGSLAVAGATERARSLLEDLQRRKRLGDFVASLDLALPLAALGEVEEALAALERGAEERNAHFWARIHFPDFAPLRRDARWRALQERVTRLSPVDHRDSSG